MDVEKTMEFILEQQAAAAVWQAKTEENMAEFSDGLKRLDRRLTRAVRLAVREARAERARRRELDDRLTASRAAFQEEFTKLAAAQRATEESLRAFIDSMRRGGNGRQSDRPA